jgi:hypothetical protein
VFHDGHGDDDDDEQHQHDLHQERHVHLFKEYTPAAPSSLQLPIVNMTSINLIGASEGDKVVISITE